MYNSAYNNHYLPLSQAVMARFEYKDYYTILGVPRSAALEEIKARYRQLAVELHPGEVTASASIAAAALVVIVIVVVVAVVVVVR